ncbi:MAG: fluoride efflux transporter CrcB [Bacteroidales bacterium]|nr:fluoride efflux transporter CrcB [Bacteroidales bacterium]
MKIVLLLAGGAIGTLARYALAGFTHKVYSGTFPMGTLAVNLLGSFIIGFLWGISESKNISPNYRSFVFIGLLGGFTTFSTYALETMNLVRANEIRQAITNVLVTNIAGLVLVFIGFFIARGIINQIR